MQIARKPESAVVVAESRFWRPALACWARSSNRTSAESGSRARLDYSQIFFGPLPGVNDEVRALKQLLPQATFLTKEQATKAALQAVVAPSILHIATQWILPAERSARRQADDRSNQRPDAIGQVGRSVENPLLRSGLALAGANQARSGNEGRHPHGV